MELSRPSAVKELLVRHGLQPSRSLGQNFLVDRNFLQKIVQAAAISPGDTVLEVGPGLGTLTQALALAGAQVLAIEKDRRLQPVLQEVLAGLPVQVTYADALQTDYRQLLAEATEPKVVANLPYYITTPLILGFLQSGVNWRSLTLLVQREVVDRIMATPGQKEYGLLSIAAQYFSAPALISNVPATAFYPVPGVASAIVQLPLVPTDRYGLRTTEQALFRTAQAALGQRRKTLLNALSSLPGQDRAQLQQVIAALGWRPDRRGETLSVAELVQLTNRLQPE